MIKNVNLRWLGNQQTYDGENQIHCFVHIWRVAMMTMMMMMTTTMKLKCQTNHSKEFDDAEYVWLKTKVL